MSPLVKLQLQESPLSPFSPLAPEDREKETLHWQVFASLQRTQKFDV